MTRPEFILKYYGDAKRATRGTGLFPETLLTQAILESLKSSGLSLLAKQYKNYFGIKADRAWNGSVVSLTTAEYVNNRKITVRGTNKLYASRSQAIAQGANPVTFFRVYSNTEAGFRGWVQFLQNNRRYSKVFNQKNPISQFIELQRAGYATDPNYSSLLSNIYSRNLSFFGQAQAFFASLPVNIASVLPVVFFCFY